MDKVVHFEIPADDIERAQKFYKDLFDWQIIQAGDMPYWIARTGPTDDNNMLTEPGCINGGMLKRDEQNDSGSANPMIVIKVPDLEAYCKKIQESGGEIVVKPRQVADMGMYARFKDTEGNIVGLWQDLK